MGGEEGLKEWQTVSNKGVGYMIVDSNEWNAFLLAIPCSSRKCEKEREEREREKREAEE